MGSSVPEPELPAGREPSQPPLPACPVCGSRLIEVHGKLECEQCHRICESCCEGGPLPPAEN